MGIALNLNSLTRLRDFFRVGKGRGNLKSFNLTKLWSIGAILLRCKRETLFFSIILNSTVITVVRGD